MIIYACTLDETGPRFVRLCSAFTSPMTEIYLLFYEAVLQTFVNFNKFLQREDPLIPVISEQIESFLTKLASKFIPVSGLRAAGQDFAGLKFSELSDQLPGIIIIIIIINDYNVYMLDYRSFHIYWNKHKINST